MHRKNLHTSLTWRLNNSLLVLAIAGILFSCGGGKKKDPDKIYFDNASDYNKYISSQFDEVNRLWNEALTKMDDSSLVYSQLDSLRVQSGNSYKNMGKLADWKGDTLYKHAAMEYFGYMNGISKGIFKEAIDIGLKPDLTDEEYFRFTEIGNQIGAEKDTCIAGLMRAQANFVVLAQK
jgi:hypothetical protein